MTGAKIYVAKERIDLPPLPADADTLPKNFVRRAAELGDRVAMRKKRFGIWQE